MSNRACGSCTLCCKLLPTPEMDKPANVRCEHQRHGCGCAIYKNRPLSCQLWTCMWLLGQDTEDLSRPDRSHYVIDCMPDYVKLRDNETGTIHTIPVVQVWVDPAFPNAHRDPALRDYIKRRGEQDGMGALIRYNSRDGMTMFPPAIASDGEWHEYQGGEIEPEHPPMPVRVTLA